MIRNAIILLFCLGTVLLVAPFAISSLWIDERGIAIPGHVFSKDEWVVVRDSSWTRSLEVTVEYDPPHEATVAFLKAKVSPDRFDQLKKGDLVSLRYLRREDVPHVPGANVLREMHMLPTARLADQRSWSGLQAAFDAGTTFTAELVAAGLVFLLFWRVVRLPFFGWAVAACILAVMAAVLIHSFPVLVPSPQKDIRRGSGTVKSVDLVEHLFYDQETFEAAQPIQIVGVQFVPEGRAGPVLAVDLIDANSIAGLREHSAVEVEYDGSNPRTARIRGASRDFVRINLRGIAVELGILLALVTALVLGALWMGKGDRQIWSRKSM